MDNKLDFSTLEKLNLPPINIKREDLEPVESAPLMSEEDIKEVKENTIQEVNDIADFETESEQEEDDQESSESDQEKGSSETKTAAVTSEEEELEDSEESESSEDVSVIGAISEWARAKGIFDYKDEEFEDSESFLENKLAEKSKAYADEWVESLPPVIKELVNNYQEGVPLDELIYSKSREIEYNAIEDSELEKSEGLQKKLVSDWLYTQDFSEEEIETKLKKYEDALILEDEAKTALKKLRSYESKYQEQLVAETERRKQEYQKYYADQIKNIENSIMQSEEIIPGITLSKEEKKKIFEAYTKADSSKKTQLTKAIESDPNAWFKITQFMVLMNGNLKDVEKRFNTKAAKKVKETVNTYKETPGLNKLTTPANLKAMKKAIAKIKKSY